MTFSNGSSYHYIDANSSTHKSGKFDWQNSRNDVLHPSLLFSSLFFFFFSISKSRSFRRALVKPSQFDRILYSSSSSSIPIIISPVNSDIFSIFYICVLFTRSSPPFCASHYSSLIYMKRLSIASLPHRKNFWILL